MREPHRRKCLSGETGLIFPKSRAELEIPEPPAFESWQKTAKKLAFLSGLRIRKEHESALLLFNL